MAITLRRQLNEDEKKIILEMHGRNCFATGHPIPNSDPIHFDPINVRIGDVIHNVHFLQTALRQTPSF